jgi:Uma2 family endonuclease
MASPFWVAKFENSGRGVNMTATLELPSVLDQEAFNLARWAEICADPVLAKLEFRVESDAYGNPIMSPPPAFSHGSYQSDIAFRLRTLLPHGKVATECPISTNDGVRAADVVWISAERQAISLKQNVLTVAPEICVEVLSPRNTRNEMDSKKRLYFAAGADEVWFCDLQGRMFFYTKSDPSTPVQSTLCPGFPEALEAS